MNKEGNTKLRREAEKKAENGRAGSKLRGVNEGKVR